MDAPCRNARILHAAWICLLRGRIHQEQEHSEHIVQELCRLHGRLIAVLVRRLWLHVRQRWRRLHRSANFCDLSFYTHPAGLPTEGFLMFQTVFCATSATIVSGAMAERTKFSMYVIYSILISLIIYPVEGHWTWGGGWLMDAAETPS